MRFTLKIYKTVPVVAALAAKSGAAGSGVRIRPNTVSGLEYATHGILVQKCRVAPLHSLSSANWRHCVVAALAAKSGAAGSGVRIRPNTVLGFEYATHENSEQRYRVAILHSLSSAYKVL